MRNTSPITSNIVGFRYGTQRKSQGFLIRLYIYILTHIHIPMYHGHTCIVSVVCMRPCVCNSGAGIQLYPNWRAPPPRFQFQALILKFQNLGKHVGPLSDCFHNTRCVANNEKLRHSGWKMHSNLEANLHIYVYMYYTYDYVYMCIYTHGYTYRFVSLCMSMYAYIYIHIHTCSCTFKACAHAHVYIYTYVYIDRWIHR